MSRLVVFAAMALVLTACSSDGGKSRDRARPGHIALGESFTFPACSTPPRREDGVHYVTQPARRPLTGTIVLEYEITGDGVLAATEGGTPLLTLYFQRRGDDWTAKGDMASYRWYSRTRSPLATGPGRIEAPLSSYAAWGAVVSAGQNALMFEQAKQDASRVGFVLGNSGGAGHGVCASSGKVTLTVKRFAVE